MKRREICLYAALLIAVNLPLVHGMVPQWALFLPDRVAEGELWRLLTHPFAHVTWYHLLLDGTAFLLLYAQLSGGGLGKRTGYVAASAVGSLAAAACALPSLQALGYCGLSGVGHGLMAVVALQTLRRPDPAARTAGQMSLALLAAKTLLEALTGTVVLEFLHFGLMGTPVALAHLGGFIGGAAMFGLYRVLSVLFACTPISSSSVAAMSAGLCPPVANWSGNR